MNTPNVRPVFNLIILDESGSMQSIKTSIVGSFNETLQVIINADQKHEDQNHFVTFVTFDSEGIREHNYLQPASSLQKLTMETYLPGAATPLYDAIGESVLKLKHEIERQKPADYDVLVTILTDGQENASRKFTGVGIKNIIDELKQQKWVFSYIGANHNVEATAAMMGIEHTIRFESEEESVQSIMQQDMSSRATFFEKRVFNYNPKKTSEPIGLSFEEEF
ncbi:MAG: VWA domain-containing protein [Spirosomataceae bacterium]